MRLCNFLNMGAQVVTSNSPHVCAACIYGKHAHVATYALAHDFIVVLADRSRRGSVLAGSLVFSCHGMVVRRDLAECIGCRTS